MSSNGRKHRFHRVPIRCILFWVGFHPDGEDATFCCSMLEYAFAVSSLSRSGDWLSGSIRGGMPGFVRMRGRGGCCVGMACAWRSAVARSRGRAVAPVSSNSYLVSSFYSVWLSLACSRHVTGSFASQNLTYFAPTRQWFPERTISSQATCCNVLNNDAPLPIALYLY